MRKKHISIEEARGISKSFCKDFDIPYCEIYFVDKILGCWGCYIWLDPPHILIKYKIPNRIGILMHELVHHMDSYLYKTILLGHSGSYQLAKKRVITWCNNNLSNKPDWKQAFKANPTNEEMVKFQL